MSRSVRSSRPSLAPGPPLLVTNKTGLRVSLMGNAKAFGARIRTVAVLFADRHTRNAPEGGRRG